jgi:hypothetical protein
MYQINTIKNNKQNKQNKQAYTQNIKLKEFIMLNYSYNQNKLI